jgi:hypothetical protein
MHLRCTMLSSMLQFGSGEWVIFKAGPAQKVLFLSKKSLLRALPT